MIIIEYGDFDSWEMVMFLVDDYFLLVYFFYGVILMFKIWVMFFVIVRYCIVNKVRKFVSCYYVIV